MHIEVKFLFKNGSTNKIHQVEIKKLSAEVQTTVKCFNKTHKNLKKELKT